MKLQIITKIVLKLLVASLICFILLETSIALFLFFPNLSKYGPYEFVREIYMDKYRSIMQFEPTYARYDPELSYILNPGSFLFPNREFKNEFQINSLGVRDDEKSLDSPVIIVAGDSEAMGWGISQLETYAQVVEQKTGLKVLNAAIPSYSTVREMRILDRIDTTELKYLVIHYDIVSDYYENAIFHFRDNALPIMDEEFYEKTVNEHLGNKRYYLGKYIENVWWALLHRVNLVKRDSPEKQDEPHRTGFFLNALINASHVDLKDVKIIVVGDGDFIVDLKQVIATGDFPSFIEKIHTINLSNVITKDCYYVLDDHLKAKGHAIIADEILKIMVNN